MDATYTEREPGNGLLRALRRITGPNAMRTPQVPSPADLLTPSEADLLALPIATGTLRTTGTGIA